MTISSAPLCPAAICLRSPRDNTAVPLSDLTFLKRAVPERNRHELYHHIASNLRGWVDHLEMAGEGPSGVGSSVAFSARRPKL